MHLGLGNFFRAHQAWYTGHAVDGEEWGYCAFGGRGSALATLLEAQGGLYTLIERGTETDTFEVVRSVVRAHGAGDHDAWLETFAGTGVAAVTMTVTEAGYCRRVDGGLDADRPEVRADVGALRRDMSSPVRTAPARLVAGLSARIRAGAGPVTLVPCDNVPSNGMMVERVVGELASLVSAGLARSISGMFTVTSTVVDRITAAATDADMSVVAGRTGYDDRCPVVTEPFSEWVLSGSFPAGRPAWESAGAVVADDVTPYEQRKLWLLNGAHSLLAYTGSMRRRATVPEAVSDPICRRWLDEWWEEASRHLDQPEPVVAAYRTALLGRFHNVRLGDRLGRIAADGSQKLPVRIVPVLSAERAAGRMPLGAVRVVAAWVCHLRGAGGTVVDARRDEIVPLAQGDISAAVPRVLGVLDAAMGLDRELAEAVVEQCHELEALTVV